MTLPYFRPSGPLKVGKEGPPTSSFEDPPLPPGTQFSEALSTLGLAGSLDINLIWGKLSFENGLFFDENDSSTDDAKSFTIVRLELKKPIPDTVIQQARQESFLTGAYCDFGSSITIGFLEKNGIQEPTKEGYSPTFFIKKAGYSSPLLEWVIEQHETIGIESMPISRRNTVTSDSHLIIASQPIIDMRMAA
jgi:hypothetical protein